MFRDVLGEGERPTARAWRGADLMAELIWRG
jgi:hypothetical protein